MCGIYGYTVVDDLSKEAIKDFNKLLERTAYEMSFRGTDSWGWSAINKNSVGHLKGLGDASKTSMGFPSIQWRCAIGHTRYATVGSVSLANAHPFVRDHVHGAHNGSITNYNELGKKLGATLKVDSDALIRLIAEEAEGLHDIEGYGAVTWLDENLGLAFLCRMRHGDLEAASCKHKDGGRIILWASKLHNLMQWAATNLKKIKSKKLPKLVEGTVYVVKDGQLRRTKRTLILKGWESQYAHGYGWCGGDWDGDDGYATYYSAHQGCWMKWNEKKRTYEPIPHGSPDEPVTSSQKGYYTRTYSKYKETYPATGGAGISDETGQVVIPAVTMPDGTKSSAPLMTTITEKRDVVNKDAGPNHYNWWEQYEKDGVTLKYEVFQPGAVFYDRDAHEWWPWESRSDGIMHYPIFDPVTGEYMEHASLEEIVDYNESLDEEDDGSLDIEESTG